MANHRTQNWTLTKPAARSSRGVVVSQSGDASQVGADILAAGGNAIDAAVATAFALGVVEPGNSGIGGIGFMVVHRAGEAAAKVVAFGPVSPLGIDPAAYPLVGGMTEDLFSWPAVKDARNQHGALSFGVPGAVDGLALALERWGKLPLAEVLKPAIALADKGMPVNWHSQLRISNHAALLSRYETSKAIYLPGGLPPIAAVPTAYRKQGELANTMRRLAEHGRRDFYEGGIAADLVADIQAMGGVLSAEDLRRYRAQVIDSLPIPYRGHVVQAVPGLTAGPTLAQVLGGLSKRTLGTKPDATAFLAYADELAAAYTARLAGVGDVSPVESCTTHLCAVDGEGTMVSITNTLLSIFGSCVTLPKTGVLMNNGMFWFDTRPGRPNSIGAGKRPLCNMCPVVVAKDGAPVLAVGASGGRRIMPAVMQLVSFTLDFGLGLEEVAHHPRIDASGNAKVDADPRLDAEVLDALKSKHEVDLVENLVFPVSYANPCMVRREIGTFAGITDVASPFSAAISPA